VTVDDVSLLSGSGFSIAGGSDAAFGAAAGRGFGNGTAPADPIGPLSIHSAAITVTIAASPRRKPP
jgi:hypothetical protein